MVADEETVTISCFKEVKTVYGEDAAKIRAKTYR